MDRIWGGRKLEELYHKPIPGGKKIGESWEVSDRPGAESKVAHGPLAGKSIRWLIENHTQDMLGSGYSGSERFPLLIKILDAQEKLSLQVHPPQEIATSLGGEPKTEMWYIADATPEASLFVGLKKGITPERFARDIEHSRVADCFHEIRVKKGDSMFLPSGRVHALGAGNVIFEIQQNSDTTYRVYDWDRRNPDGSTRELHVEKSLKSIDFNDFEPRLTDPVPQLLSPGYTLKQLANDPLFHVSLHENQNAVSLKRSAKSGFLILGFVEGSAVLTSSTMESPLYLRAGQFCFIPDSVRDSVVSLAPKSKVLEIHKPLL